MERLVAAHRTLPFNTWVRVTNLNNSKNVEVRIIDRGPFVDGRIIDLSHAAAQAVDMIGTGIAQVRVEVIAAPPNPEPSIFGVQVGAFANRINADRMVNDMQIRYGSAKLISRQGNTTTWRVVVGRENTTENAETLAMKIRSAENLPQAFVVRVDSAQ
jgi:rare lipoprotein A